MSTSNIRSLGFWAGAFVLLFLLSLDYWWWDGPVRFGPFGLPAWVYYFAILQLLLALAVWRFGRKHWTSVGGDETNGGADGS